MRNGPRAPDSVRNGRLDIESLTIETMNEIAAERGFSSKEMRTARDIEHDPIRRIDPDQRRVAVTPIGDCNEQMLIGLGIMIRTEQFRIHGARINERQTGFEAKRCRFRIDGNEP